MARTPSLENEAVHCSQPHELLSLQAAYNTEVAARLVKLHEQAWTHWLELLGACWCEAERLGAALLQPWHTEGAPPSAASSPVELYLDMVEHDLEAAPRQQRANQ